MMQYLFSRFCSLSLNYLLQSLNFHWIFILLGFLFPVFFPSAGLCFHSKLQSSPFLGTGLGKSLVTASCCRTELCASPTGFAWPAVRELDTTEVFLFLLLLPQTLTPTHVNAFILYLFISHFYPLSPLVLFLSLIVFSSFILKQLGRLWKLQNFHHPTLPAPFFKASFTPKCPGNLCGQHNTGAATWHIHGFFRIELKNILS